MKPFPKFVAVGSAFATVEEFLTVAVLKRDAGAYVFTLLVLFPAFLTLVFFGARSLGRWIASEPRRELAHFFFGGAAGLAIEWFLIGLSPWSNPSANPFLMLGFQLGMFSFWATVAFAPQLFVNSDAVSQRFRARIVRFYGPYFALVYAVALMLPRDARFGPAILLIVAGYLTVCGFLARYFWIRFKRP